MIVAAFEEWYQNTNGQMIREFLFDDLWSRIQDRIQRWETKGHQVCGFSDAGPICAFRDQLNRGMRLSAFSGEDFECLQYIEDVDSHDWTIYVTEKSSRTSGFLRTQAWTRQGLRRTVYREYTDRFPDEKVEPAQVQREVVLTMAEEEGLRTESLEACSIQDIEERISIAYMRVQMAVFGQE